MIEKKFYTLFILLTVLTLTANAQSRYAEHSKLATGKWVKIRVKDEGVYQLSASSLKSMGFSNPEKVSLYGYNLPILPETFIENISDDLTQIPLYRKADGTALFYSCGTIQWNRKNNQSPYTHKNNPYSSYIYYFLTDSGTPTQMTSIDATPKTTTEGKTEYYAHTLEEKDAFSFLNCGRTFFDSYDFATGPRKTYNLTFNNRCTGDISLEVKFGASGKTSSTLSVAVGDNNLGTINFAADSQYEYASVGNKSFTLYDQAVSSLNVTLQHTRGTAVTGHLDYICASYPAELSLQGKNFLSFQDIGGTATNYRFSLQGANSSTSIWEVTSPSQTREVKGILSGTTYWAEPYVEANFKSKFVAVNTAATFPTPETVGDVVNQDLHALDSINLLIIVPSNGTLTAQAQRLANAHKDKDGLICTVVTAEQVYNEFSSGTPDATAYRRLMKMLYERQYTSSPLSGTQKGSLNLLLFGNCFWDNRLITKELSSKSQDDYLLAYESDNSWSHTDSYVAEEYFTLLADGKGASPLKEAPDCGVGRLPVTSELEAKAVVDKLITYIYNVHAGAWKNTICMMGDDDTSTIHMEDAENVLTNTAKLFPNYNYQRIYWDSYNREQSATGNSYPEVYAAIDKTMQEGALIMNYTGHGAAYTLSHEQVLRTSEFQSWTSPRLPLWITAACDVAPFDMNTENLACEAVLNKQGAAMGFIGTARTVYSTPNRTINRNFMSHVLGLKNNGEHFTIGEALAQAKADILYGKTYLSRLDTLNKAHFILLGDPAIRLITPTHTVKIDAFNGQSIGTSEKPTISARETITVAGHIEDENGETATQFKGTINTTVFDSEEHIICKNNMHISGAPFEYDARTRTIFTGTDSVTAGKFSFTFPVPLDINYSNLSGLILLYATNQEKTAEAQGRFEDFLIGGTKTDAVNDTIGPSIATFSDGYNMTDYHYTTETPTLYINLSDSTGINTTQNGLGHDIVAIIDGNESTTYTLNSYYSPSVGDYRSGTVTYTLPALAPGVHTMVIRAFDTFNNLGQAAYKFEVVEGLTKEYEIFDMAGRRLHNVNDTVSLPRGIYIRRERLTCPKGVISSKVEKFIVTQ